MQTAALEQSGSSHTELLGQIEQQQAAWRHQQLELQRQIDELTIRLKETVQVRETLQLKLDELQSRYSTC